ncbi:hypothetical protein BP5796_08949 [Coleophoma crateriformis]|uniref:Carboxypeptidase n=1 Tax=Coleophoma crateriformis TaxID=565419 RepID=A0A3D8R2L0_9HELO|nr:hypothetical protein BP5796_08949 [Coleophoma crateriformis]
MMGLRFHLKRFFWFFEARKDPENAPLSIWLNGGPGASSFIGLLQENGPCFVGNDSNSTYLNPWSWNNEVNMLYIDQPAQVGFSYDVLTNGTYEPWNETITPTDFPLSEALPEQNNTFYLGTFASQSSNATANTTEHAAHAIWHFAQTWFEEFPAYKPKDEKISLWTESYGGRYGPGFFRFWQEQNERILNGSIAGPGTHLLKLDTLGIINGCLDCETQMLAYADFAWNNTYGIKVINESQYDEAIESFWKEGGCRDGILKCKAVAGEMDPLDKGSLEYVDKICIEARANCQTMNEPYEKYPDKPRSRFDIAHPAADPFPEPYYSGYLNQHWVQSALGVPVNHTVSSGSVSAAFRSTGDYARGSHISALGYLLDNGIKVHTMYGDRDFACNWVEGERALHAVEYEGAEGFRNAGYTPVYTEQDGIGGMVKQHGNFSFARIFQAGHEVPAYQPSLAYAVFMRAMFNKDIGTGLIPVFDDFTTVGPASTWHITNAIPEWPESVCYIKVASGSCTPEQWKMVEAGKAVIKDWIVVGYEEDGELVIENGKEEKQRVLEEA